jgi:hypothetical protein
MDVSLQPVRCGDDSEYITVIDGPSFSITIILDEHAGERFAGALLGFVGPSVSLRQAGKQARLRRRSALQSIKTTPQAPTSRASPPF